MQKFIVSLVFFFLSFHSLNWAAEFDQGLPITPSLDPEVHWRDMLNHAQTRSQWFMETTQALSDSKLPLEQRYAIAQKISPKIDDSMVIVSVMLSRGTQQKLRYTKVINVVLSDLIYASLYWKFLERNIEFYSQEPHNTLEIRKSVLPHLARELIHADSYAMGDLKNESTCKYTSEEFFLNRAIHEECEALAKYYEVAIEHMPPIIDKQTHEPITFSEMKSSALSSITVISDPEAASNILPYFMEQLIHYRNFLNRLNVNGRSIPDLNDPKLMIFQSYILPWSGPTLIDALKQPIIDTKTDTGVKTAALKKEKKTIKSKAKKHKRNKRAPHQSEPSPDQAAAASSKNIEGESDESSGSPDDQIEAVAPPIGVPVLDLAEPKAAATSSSSQKVVPGPLVAVKAPTIQVLNIRDIRLRVEHRYSTTYTFLDTEFKLPFFERSMSKFDEDFLRRVKSMTHLSPKTDKLPNIATGFITFHMRVGKNPVSKTIKFEELFLSGAKYFAREDLQFKDQYVIVNAMQDMLSFQEQESIRKIPHGKKGIPLGIAMEKKLRRLIIEGPWRSNCVDSEALFLLTLYKKLPHILRGIVVDGSGQSIKILGAILGISSLRDCCPNCQKLIQGFQWRLQDIISTLQINQLSVDDDFGTLAITLGHMRHMGKYPYAMPDFLNGFANLEPRKHKLICTQLQGKEPKK